MAFLMRLEHLWRAYGDHQVIHDLSLDICPGESIALVGPNGSGKSTLLRMLAGYDRADAGTIFYNGADVTRTPITLRQDVGYLSDRPFVYTHLTTSEFLAFVAGVRKAPANRVTEIKAALAIPDILIADMSYGTMRKVAIASILLHAPALLLMDEPFNALDYAANLMLQKIITTLKQQGCAIMLATHYFPAAVGICDRFLLLTPQHPPTLFERGDISETSFEEMYMQLCQRGGDSC